jgi:two-component system, sporulation sensor kinase A
MEDNKAVLLGDELFYSAFHYSAMGMALVALDGRSIAVNDALCSVLGYTRQELTRVTFQQITYSQDIDQETELFERLVAGQLPSYQMEKRYLHKSGQLVWVLLSASIVRSKDGEPLYVVSQIQDITGRKVMEQELRSVQHQYELLAENAVDIITFSSPDGTFQFISPASRTLLGYMPEEMLGKQAICFFHPDDKETISQLQLADTDTFDCRVKHKEGHYVWIETTIRMIRDEHGETAKLIGIGRDITRRKDMENDLRRSQERLREAQRISKIGSWEWDVSRDYIKWSEESFRIFGKGPGEFLGKLEEYYQFIHPGDRGMVEAAVTKALNGEEYDYVCRLPAKDDQWKYIHVRGAQQRNAEGVIVGINGTVQDITDRILQEQKLEETIERYTSLKKYNPDAVVSLTHLGEIISGNAAAETLSGYKAEELKGMHFTDFITDPYLELAQERFKQFLSGNLIEETHIVLRNKHGQLLDVVATPAPIVIKGNIVGCYLIIKDITEQRKKDELLIRSEKQSIAGQLAAAIAHEIRNPLTAIKGFFQLMRSGSIKDAYFNILNEEFIRIEMILGELMVLAKPQDMKMESKDLVRTLQSVTLLLESQANMNNVTIRHCFEAEEILIRCDENQIKQVFINMLKNAIEVMPKGGAVEILVKPEDGFVTVSITDHGCGIPRELLDRIGQPFYSTKEKGTGLGLMVSYRIIENHGGSVTIRSVVDEGTTFEVKLPRLN